jgi:hypothetical protein
MSGFHHELLAVCAQRSSSSYPYEEYTQQRADIYCGQVAGLACLWTP